MVTPAQRQRAKNAKQAKLPSSATTGASTSTTTSSSSSTLLSHEQQDQQKQQQHQAPAPAPLYNIVKTKEGALVDLDAVGTLEPQAHRFRFDPLRFMFHTRALLSNDFKALSGGSEKFDQHLQYDMESDFDAENDWRMKPHKLPEAQRDQRATQLVKELKEQAQKMSDQAQKKSKFPLVMLVVIVVMVVLMFGLKMGEEEFVIKDKFEEIDYYSALNLSDQRSCSPADIKRAYRKMVIKMHPDRNPDCGDECVKVMGQINEAYLVLSNAETRAFHDRYGVRPPENMMSAAKAKKGGRGRQRARE